MSSIIIRLATKHDIESLLRMPPYSRGCIVFPFEEDILVAERDGDVVGVISVGHRDTDYVSGEWKDSYEHCLNAVLKKVSSCWISKLYVLPEHRCQGIGTTLVKRAVRFLKERGFTEAYASIYIKNEFRETSRRIFEGNGFDEIGSCICRLSQGYCRGTLLRCTLRSSDGEG